MRIPRTDPASSPTDYLSAAVGEQIDAAPPADGSRYGADLIVDALHSHEIEYVALNPGASFRGLHDSLVNYGGDRPKMILCLHEVIAVGMAHGYAKAHSPSKPMAAILHDVVGLLNGSMATYVAYVDRVPILILGGTGPMNEAKRRPGVDWHHTALIQGNAVRDFVKWDDQPYSPDSVADSFGRGYRVAMTEPRGPIYICYDAQLQEDPLPPGFVTSTSGLTQLPSGLAAEHRSLERAAELLVNARRPVIVAQHLGRNHDAADALVELAEALAAPVLDMRSRPNFPTCHRLNLTGSDVIREADLVLALDVRYPDSATVRVDSASREHISLVDADATRIEIGLSDLDISSWGADFGKFHNMDLSILADTALAVPMLTELVKERLAGDHHRQGQIASRAADLAERHRLLRAGWLADAREDWDATPMTTGRLALEVWEAIKNEDWVLTAGTLEGRVLKLWDFDRPYRHPGERLGPGTQIGISLGVALAHKGSGRLVVDLQPDGDLLYNTSALWTLARYEIPLLIVMFNNRAYYNDWEHQIEIAKFRGTPVGRAGVGQDIRDPDPDFAGMARSMGVYAEGPIEDPKELGPALERAIAQVMQGRPALVDAITRFR